MRYSYAQLAEAMAKIERQPRVSDKTAAFLLGVSERQIRRARKEGMNEWEADLYACRLWLHPLDIWGDEWLTPQAMWAGDLMDGTAPLEVVERFNQENDEDPQVRELSEALP